MADEIPEEGLRQPAQPEQPGQPGQPAQPEEAEYVPPEALPPPEREPAGAFPLAAIALGVLAAVALGAALFAVSQAVYIYLLFNYLIGLGIGAAIAFGAGRAKYRNGPVLGLLVAVCSFLAYLTFNLGMWLFVKAEVEAELGEVFGFWDFLVIRAAYETFIGEMTLGTLGNCIVWAIELGITIYYAWKGVKAKLVVLAVEDVPAAVTAMVLHFEGQGVPREAIRGELARRGWSGFEEQDRAFKAVDALVAAVGAAGATEEPD